MSSQLFTVLVRPIAMLMHYPVGIAAKTVQILTALLQLWQ